MEEEREEETERERYQLYSLSCVLFKNSRPSFSLRLFLACPIL
jgi:hypothetical protein